jgi:4-amino-4-deoxy-L-arabinose transferase-like glycosyltransferase
MNAEFWFDEIATVQNEVRKPAADIIVHYGAANNHVFNSLLAHVCASIGGERPWVVRLPAVLFGIASVWAFYFVARLFWEESVALLGTLLFAVSYHHVYYTQQARGYSAFVFFALLATGMLIRLLRAETNRAANWYGVGYALSLGLGAYSLLLTGFLVVGHACALLLGRRWRALLWLGAGGVVTGLLYAPMASSLLTYYREHPSYTGHPIFSLAFAQELRPLAIPLVIGALVTPFLLMRLGRRQPLAAAILFLPLVFTILLPALRGQGAHPRSLIYGLPLGYLLLTVALEWGRTRFRWLVLGGVVVASVASLVMLRRYYTLPKQGFQQALDYVAAHRQPGDDVIGLTLGGKAVRFYDPSVVLINNAEELEAWKRQAKNRTWVVYTFGGELQGSAPTLSKWVRDDTDREETFPGVIGDGEVYVHLWPRRSSK